MAHINNFNNTAWSFPSSLLGPIPIPGASASSSSVLFKVKDTSSTLNFYGIKVVAGTSPQLQFQSSSGGSWTTVYDGTTWTDNKYKVIRFEDNINTSITDNNLHSVLLATGAILIGTEIIYNNTTIASTFAETKITKTLECASQMMSTNVIVNQYENDHIIYTYTYPSVTISNLSGAYSPLEIYTGPDILASNSQRLSQAEYITTIPVGGSSTFGADYQYIQIIAAEPWQQASISSNVTKYTTYGFNSIIYKLDNTSAATISGRAWCLTGDTLVTMADGSTKRIDMIEVGDYILSYDWNTMKLISNKVIYTDKDEHKAWIEYDIWKFDDGSKIKTVHRHEFYNIEAKCFKYMDEWVLGEHAYKIDGTKPKFISHETVREGVSHYKITGESGTNYFANELLTGDRGCPKNIQF